MLALVRLGIIYTLVARRPARTIAKCSIGGGHRAVFAVAELYLAVDHPFDITVAVGISTALPLTAFRLFTPNEIVPRQLPAGQDRPPRCRRTPG